MDYRLLDPNSSPWVGLAHFDTIFTKYQLFWTAIKNTLSYALLINAAMLPLALLFAYCLSNIGRGSGFYRGAMFLPVVVSMAAVSLLFQYLMEPIGIMNMALKALGLPPCDWLAGAKSALPSIVLVALWKELGGNIVILAAGLTAIPLELYDAAKVDGANTWQTFWRVTVPLLGPTLKFVAILVTIGGLQAYTSVLLLTSGGPAYKTYMISQFIVEEAFSNFRFGLASAASFVLFAVILAVTLLQLRVTKTKWEY